MDVEIAGRIFQIPSDKRYPGPGTTIHTEWAAFAVCYHATYKSWPEYHGVAAGLITNILKEVPKAEFPATVAAFLRSRETYVVSRGHDLKVLKADAQKYLTQSRTGKGMTATQARQEDRMAAAQDTAAAAIELARKMREASGNAQ